MPRYLVLGAVLIALLGATLEASPHRPNIVVVLVDDLSVDEYEAALSSNVWPSIREQIVEAGTKFTNSFVSTALCAPSRATFLTGQHSHNHRVRDNKLPTGGVTMMDDTKTLPVWLKAKGYRTGLVGKYINGYGTNETSSPKDNPSYIPPGWDDWQALIGIGMYDYNLSDNGVVVAYGSAPSDYQTDVLKGRALDFIEDAEAQDSKPFFLVVTPFAPHLEPGVDGPGCSSSAAFPETIRPAARDSGTLPPGIVLTHGPAYNEADMSDKPPILQSLPVLTALDTTCGEGLWRARLEAMMAVDELVGALVADLAQKGELDDTVIIFTSDNGFFFGEHRLSDKIIGYEEANRVPLAIRAPGYAEGQVSPRMVLNADLAPTITELAQAVMGLAPEGRSLVPLLANPMASPWRKRVFGEFQGTRLGGRRFSLVRTGPQDAPAPDDVYIAWNAGTREYYDLDTDPYQLTSRHADPGTATQRAYLEAFINQFKTCVGTACVSLEN